MSSFKVHVTSIIFGPLSRISPIEFWENPVCNMSSNNDFTVNASITKPVIVGHRGFRGYFPENTMLAFKEGISAGASILEMDIQVSSDDVVVMCHDPNTGRCFDADYKVETTPYHGVLDKLRTKDKFAEPMPTFKDVGELLFHETQFNETKIIIDIKRSNEPSCIAHLRKAMESVATLAEWKSRCILGVWKSDVLHAVEKLLPTLDVVFIGFETGLAREFLKCPQVVAISLNYSAYIFGGSRELVNECRERDMRLYAWTVNSPEAMKWCVAARMDGVITDYPDVAQKFLNNISEKDMLDQYFTSKPHKFFSIPELCQMLGWYMIARFYLAMSSYLPKRFCKI